MVLAMISLAVFQLRFWHRFKQQQVKRMWWQHLIDTLLLISGILLAYLARFNPLTSDWLGLKLLCLVAYIVFGLVAMKTHKFIALIAYGLATLAALEIIILATQKQPWPF